MSVTAGTRLGPYEVVAPIGAGGMGQVWRASDARLDRTVAIKVLPGDFARNANLRIRLEREARAISALSHPNICTLYDIGHDNGIDYLVMEYVDGETLAGRLARGPLPLDQVLRYGTEIAGALDRAHKKGIVHRDLKPEERVIRKTLLSAISNRALALGACAAEPQRQARCAARSRESRRQRHSRPKAEQLALPAVPAVAVTGMRNPKEAWPTAAVRPSWADWTLELRCSPCAA